ncbi:unnamed protein product [Notodromas monacha]|uniref:Uncharacterized protein n=1 Tax=Notodromas monacha TaxID=399045 RepID=A0A7R9GEP9_9CRUS|nr:unnamed protein product [Notodromas monacha]CAG0918100.1 unnamed protein product [Notodromas monacha]
MIENSCLYPLRISAIFRRRLHQVLCVAAFIVDTSSGFRLQLGRRQGRHHLQQPPPQPQYIPTHHHHHPAHLQPRARQLQLPHAAMRPQLAPLRRRPQHPRYPRQPQFRPLQRQPHLRAPMRPRPLNGGPARSDTPYQGFNDFNFGKNFPKLPFSFDANFGYNDDPGKYFDHSGQSHPEDETQDEDYQPEYRPSEPQAPGVAAAAAASPNKSPYDEIADYDPSLEEEEDLDETPNSYQQLPPSEQAPSPGRPFRPSQPYNQEGDEEENDGDSQAADNDSYPSPHNGPSNAERPLYARPIDEVEDAEKSKPQRFKNNHQKTLQGRPKFRPNQPYNIEDNPKIYYRAPQQNQEPEVEYKVSDDNIPKHIKPEPFFRPKNSRTKPLQDSTAVSEDDEDDDEGVGASQAGYRFNQGKTEEDDDEESASGARNHERQGPAPNFRRNPNQFQRNRPRFGRRPILRNQNQMQAIKRKDEQQQLTNRMDVARNDEQPHSPYQQSQAEHRESSPTAVEPEPRDTHSSEPDSQNPSSSAAGNSGQQQPQARQRDFSAQRARLEALRQKFKTRLNQRMSATSRESPAVDIDVQKIMEAAGKDHQPYENIGGFIEDDVHNPRRIDEYNSEAEFQSKLVDTQDSPNSRLKDMLRKRINQEEMTAA